MSSYPSQFPEHMQQQYNHHQYQHHVQQPMHTHRRPSLAHATAPYTIPQKLNNPSGNNNPFSPPSHTGGPIYKTHNSAMPPMQNEYSASLPLLSRDFVVRRISEGETGRLKEELKCEACGKGYKHISSLAKHLWEHTPEWNVTKKLLISKHQQVQLLELASILCSMTEPPLTPRTSPSRHLSDSPVEFDNVDPSTSNSSNSPSPFDAPHQSQYTPSSTTNNSLIAQNVSTETKFRHNSISQYPPTADVTSPPYHKLKHSEGGGGYIDVVENSRGHQVRKNSITSPDSRKEDDDGLVNSYNGSYLSSVPEHEGKNFQYSYHHKNSVSTLNSEKTLKNSAITGNDDEEVISDGKEEEEGVFGAMD